MSKLKVLTYNVFLRPLGLLLRDGQGPRAERLVNYLNASDADVVVLNELLDDAVASPLLAGLRKRFPFQTSRVGEQAFQRRRGFRRRLKIHGGVAIVSRLPFDRHAECRFGARAIGDDKLADKGVVYVRLLHASGPVHLFGFHANAQRRGAKARGQQFQLLRSFVDVQQIGAHELVLMAGDFNVAPDSVEFVPMLQCLAAAPPLLLNREVPSFDSRNNSMARGPREHLDYVLWSQRHGVPVQANNETLRPVVAPWSQRPFYRDCTELSDHYPVLAEFELRRPSF